MTLPVAPPYTTLVPPRLFSSIYGIPGGGYVPAMCSVLVRRDAGFDQQVALVDDTRRGALPRTVWAEVAEIGSEGRGGDDQSKCD